MVEVWRKIEKMKMCRLMWSAICGRHLSWLTSLEATMVVDKEGWGSTVWMLAARVRAHQGWIMLRSHSASMAGLLRQATASSGRRAAPLFLPAWMPYGRQFQYLAGDHGAKMVVLWRSHRPKWFVPGGGEIESGWKLLWTRLHFFISVWGPLCKNQGLVCNFHFIWGPSVICNVMFI